MYDLRIPLGTYSPEIAEIICYNLNEARQGRKGYSVLKRGRGARTISNYGKTIVFKRKELTNKEATRFALYLLVDTIYDQRKRLTKKFKKEEK